MRRNLLVSAASSGKVIGSRVGDFVGLEKTKRILANSLLIPYRQLGVSRAAGSWQAHEHRADRNARRRYTTPVPAMQVAAVRMSSGNAGTCLALADPYGLGGRGRPESGAAQTSIPV